MSDIKEQLATAQTLRTSNQLDEAQALYQTILSLQPKELTALMGLGYILRQRGQRSQALAHFRLIEKEYYSEHAWVKLAIVEELRDLGDTKQAFIILDKLQILEPNNFHIIWHKGLCYRKQGDSVQALAHLKQAALMDSNNLNIDLEIAVEYRNQGNFIESLLCFEQLQQKYPPHFQVLYNKGQCYRAQGNKNEALSCFQQALLVEPTNFWAKMAVIEHFQSINDYEQALELLNDLLAVQTNNILLLQRKAKIYRAQGEYEHAINCLKYILTIEPTDFSAQLEIAILLREQLKIEEALIQLNQLAQTYPPHFQILFQQGHCYRAQGDRIQSFNYFQQALLVEPNNFWGKIAIIEELRDKGEFEKALDLLQQLPIEPSNEATILFHKAILYRHLNDRKQALLYFQKARELNCNDLWINLSLADEFREQGDVNQALIILNELQFIYSENYRIFLHQGFCHRQQNNRVQALACFKQALLYDAIGTESLLHLAIEQFALGEVETAINSLLTLLKKQPNHLQALLQLGNWLNSAGAKEQALIYFQHAIDKHPFQLQPYLRAAQLLFELGKSEESFALLDKATLQCGDKADIYAQKATLYWDSRKIDEALNILETGLNLFATHYHLQVQRIYYFIEIGYFNAAQNAIAQLVIDTLDKRMRVKLLQARIYEKQWLIESAISLYTEIITEMPQFLEAHHALRRLALLQLDVESAKKHALIITQYSYGEQKINGSHGRAHLHDHVAQITDEYVLQKNLLSQLLQKTNNLTELANTVIDSSNATCTAVHFLTQLRAQQYLNKTIPKRIFQYWDKINPPAEILRFSQSWQTHNPDYDYQLFNDKSAREFLQKNCSKEIFIAYQRATHAAQKADLFRLALLYEYGGIYADADDICLKPLKQLIPDNAKFLVYQEEYGTVGNNFIASSAKHAILKQALDDAVVALLRGDKESIWLSTGPALLSRALAFYLAKNWSQATPEDLGVVIVTREELMQTVGIHAQLPYKSTQDSWLIKEFKNGQKLDLSQLLNEII